MFWQEEETVINAAETAIVDLSFAMQCRQLPLDHAYALFTAIQQALPWFTETPGTGLHLIHLTEGNGWYRPTNDEPFFYPSRRTRFSLRLPQTHVAAAQALSGQTLMIAGQPLLVGRTQVKPLHPFPVLIARHVLADPTQSENAFIQQQVQELQALELVCRKALCGKSQEWTTPTGRVLTRSLMIAELSADASLTLQRTGLGNAQRLGFGLFVPHKDIQAVSKVENKDAN